MKNEIWAVVELMGHVSLAGRLTKPDGYGALWQLDVPIGDTFATEFFGGSAVYRIRVVNEEIARAYVRPARAVIEYDAPVVTREEHERAMDDRREAYERAMNEVHELRRRLTAIQERQIPADIPEVQSASA